LSNIDATDTPGRLLETKDRCSVVTLRIGAGFNEAGTGVNDPGCK